jgi:nitrate/TMAO reductase-like tetraheme cytochrome c subunit
MKWNNHKKVNIVSWMVVIVAMIFVSGCAEIQPTVKHQPAEQHAAPSQWPLGTATPSEECGVCHQAIYREYAFGFGSDLQFKGIVYKSVQDRILNLPSNVSTSGTAHSLAGVDPFPIHARGVEEKGSSCDVCHFPEPFEIVDIEEPSISKPKARQKSQESAGLTCASCHLTPEGKIRGPYDVKAPHQTVQIVRMQTSDMCAYCHSLGKRVIGKQTQTFLEWREDFNKPGLGRQHCEDCHMPRTLRKSAEDFDVPVRAVARHLWTGGHSTQRLRTALNLVVIQAQEGKSNIEIHVINIGAGHSVPTGSNRRAVYLKTDVVDSSGNVIANREWMFAPSYGDRPDDKAFLEEDEKRPDAESAIQADAQGPYEASIRAGEERVLSWIPELPTGTYTVRASLIYDLNRYNERTFTEDQTTLSSISLTVKVE